MPGLACCGLLALLPVAGVLLVPLGTPEVVPGVCGFLPEDDAPAVGGYPWLPGDFEVDMTLFWPSLVPKCLTPAAVAESAVSLDAKLPVMLCNAVASVSEATSLVSAT